MNHPSILAKMTGCQITGFTCQIGRGAEGGIQFATVNPKQHSSDASSRAPHIRARRTEPSKQFGRLECKQVPIRTSPNGVLLSHIECPKSDECCSISLVVELL